MKKTLITVLLVLISTIVHAGMIGFENLTVTKAGIDENGIAIIGLVTNDPNQDINPAKCSEPYYRFEGPGSKGALATAMSALILDRTVDAWINTDKCPANTKQLHMIIMK